MKRRIRIAKTILVGKTIETEDHGDLAAWAFFPVKICLSQSEECKTKPLLIIHPPSNLRQLPSDCQITRISVSTSTMASSRAVAGFLAYTRPLSFSSLVLRRASFVPVAKLTSSSFRGAITSGQGFRLPPPKRWDQDEESSLE